MAGQKKRKISKMTHPELKATGQQNAKLTINSWEDVADSGDEFQISRDKILLEEEPARKKQRRIDEDYHDLLPSDEEILELPSSEGDDDDDDDLSDEGVEQDASSADEKEDEGEEEEGWGTSKKDYYNADAIETEADALEEEEEALRLQQKQLQGMTEADFGFDEADWLANGDAIEESQEDDDHRLLEMLPDVEISEEMPTEERRRILTSRYPEFEALAKEFVALEDQYEEFFTKAQTFAAYSSHVEPKLPAPGSVIRWRALGAYLGVLSMYFVLLTSGPLDDRGNHTTMNPTQLRRHPIMETLMQARKQWEKVKSMTLPDPDLTNGHETDKMLDVEAPPTASNNHSRNEETKSTKKRKSKAEARAEKAREAAEAERAARLQKTKDDLARITASVAQKPSVTIRKKTTKPTDTISDFGETITDANLQDHRKKSLAFYTSQIASKAQKRSHASRGAGGDEDIPHKERFRDRIARLNAEAQARGQKGKDDLGGASDDEDMRVATEVREQADNEDYYQTIAARTKSKKDNKAARAAALKEAAAQGAQVHEVEKIGPDGKRAITYAIQKNQGLAPKRKKEVRNPRVKKRLKYEEKMKKLGTIRQVYKGGEGRGGYGGELTGIKSGLVRSRKL